MSDENQPLPVLLRLHLKTDTPSRRGNWLLQVTHTYSRRLPALYNRPDTTASRSRWGICLLKNKLKKQTTSRSHLLPPFTLTLWSTRRGIWLLQVTESYSRRLPALYNRQHTTASRSQWGICLLQKQYINTTSHSQLLPPFTRALYNSCSVNKKCESNAHGSTTTTVGRWSSRRQALSKDTQWRGREGEKKEQRSPQGKRRSTVKIFSNLEIFSLGLWKKVQSFRATPASRRASL